VSSASALLPPIGWAKHFAHPDCDRAPCPYITDYDVCASIWFISWKFKDTRGSQVTDNAELRPVFLDVGSPARKIAVRARAGTEPGLFWLAGFNSDMNGTKAVALDQWADAHGRACVRFDYSGHGESGGAFTDGTISRWLEEAVAVFAAYCNGPQIVVGSSMGGWIALLLARELRRRSEAAANLAGLVLIAPAPDFTEALMWQQMAPESRRQIETEGVWLRPSEYGEPYPVTRGLIEDGRKHLLLNGSVETGCPVRIFQGRQDPDVPWQHAIELLAHLPGDDVVLTMIQDGDHRLSRPQDIARILAALEEF